MIQVPDSDVGGQTEEYVKSQRILKALLALIVFLPWTSEIGIGLTNPIAGILTSFVIASVLLLAFSFFQVRIERKYRQVTANQRDYFVTALPLYFVGLVPGLFGLGFSYMIPRLGLETIFYADAIIVALYLILARFPLALRIGQRATPIMDENLLSSFNTLARRMGVEVVSLYSVDWQKFKIANAFQVGPRRFSVYISNYLLGQMSSQEVNAVMAHELAHAKRRHVAKSLAIFMFPELLAINLLIFGSVEVERDSILGFVLVIGIIAGFLAPQIGFRFQRSFELDADRIAAQALGDGKPMISALQKLAELSLIPASKGSPTHPSIRARVRRLEQLAIAA